jgi:hypothetical protein
MAFPDPTGWAPEEYLNQQQLTPDQYQAERDAQAVQLGLPTGLSEADYWTAFNQLMASPEWAALQASRTAQIDQESAARLAEYEDSKSDRLRNFLAGSALAIGTAGLATGAFGGLAGAGGGTSAAGYGGAATTYPLASGGAITGSAIPGVTSATTAAGAAAAGIGATGGATNALGGAASTVPDWVGNYLMPGVNAALGVHGANEAMDAEAQALQAAIEEQRRQYDTTRADFMPAIDAMRDAHTQMSDPATHFAASPDYEFARGEGIRGTENTFAARGLGQSGNALKALTEFNSNLARGEFGNWFNRQATRAGLGTSGTGTVANVGANTANNVSNFTADRGASRASGVLGRTNQVQNGLYQGYKNYLYRRAA